MKRIITISSYQDNQFFFTKNHCQKHNLGKNYTSCTYTLPMNCVPRKSIPDGVVKDANDLISLFYSDMEEIENPDENMKPEFISGRVYT